VNEADRYYELVKGGREHFLAETADAALLRRRDQPLKPAEPDKSDTEGFGDIETNVGVAAELHRELVADPGLYEVYPLVKKPGAAFAAKITVGRTQNNDVVFNDVTVSRFHAYLRPSSNDWQVCDAGSKNGTCLGGQKLPARRETAIAAGTSIRFGDVETVFYTADLLFDILDSTAS